MTAEPAKVTVDVVVGPDQRRAMMESDVLEGLADPPRSVPPLWFYDETGSRLFDEITRLPEYYLTRAERSILMEHAGRIVAESCADTLVEIGSGTSEKTRLLLDAMAAKGSLERIVLLDISEEILRDAAAQLADRYGVPVHAVVGDLRSDLGSIPAAGRRLWAFLGSTIGNFEPGARRLLLEHFRDSMVPGDFLLLGADLVKDEERLLRAYDDASGVTAAFNLNVLNALDNGLGADFDPAGFEHRAVWNADQLWIEMRLRSTRAQTVRIKALDLGFELREDEELLTEISSKFERQSLERELGAVGLEPRVGWTDANGDFLLELAAR